MVAIPAKASNQPQNEEFLLASVALSVILPTGVFLASAAFLEVVAFVDLALAAVALAFLDVLELVAVTVSDVSTTAALLAPLGVGVVVQDQLPPTIPQLKPSLASP